MCMSSSSLSFWMQERLLARISLWLRWLPKLKSLGAQQIGLAHSGGLLAQGQVSGAGIG